MKLLQFEKTEAVNNFGSEAVKNFLYKRKVIMESKNFLGTCTKYNFLNTEKYFCY